MKSSRPYKLRLGQYSALYAVQSGRCAICGIHSDNVTGGRLHVDHDHDTGIVRGLLCRSCNTGIGKLADSPVLLRKAAEYLVSHGKADDNSVHEAIITKRGQRTALMQLPPTAEEQQAILAARVAAIPHNRPHKHRALHKLLIGVV